MSLSNSSSLNWYMVSYSLVARQRAVRDRAAWYETELSQMRIYQFYKDFVGYVSSDRHLITSCSKFQFLYIYTKLICIYICFLHWVYDMFLLPVREKTKCILGKSRNSMDNTNRTVLSLRTSLTSVLFSFLPSIKYGVREKYV